jgi:hypothetical protein
MAAMTFLIASETQFNEKKTVRRTSHSQLIMVQYIEIGQFDRAGNFSVVMLAPFFLSDA